MFSDKFIGVHCTHGINRTGYFICNYMVHRLGFNVQDAINGKFFFLIIPREFKNSNLILIVK